MSEPVSDPSSAVPVPGQGLPDAADLAAQIAARLCHDFISPASAIVSGLDLLEDPSAQDMRDDAMSLISQSARKLTDLLSFCRVAFGASNTAENFDPRELETLARGVFNYVRAEMDWSVEPPTVNKPAARILLNLAQIASGALPMGGLARIRAVEAGGRVAMTAEVGGGRIRIKPEVLAGLRGEPRGEALGGAWVQAYYLHLIVRAAGGRLAAEVGEDKATFAAWIPA